MLPRLYLPADYIRPPRVSLPPDAVHYLRHVLRLPPNAKFRVFDGRGHEYQVILRLAEEQIWGEILAEQPGPPPPQLEITLYQALPKGKKISLIIQKTTELGVARIVPVMTIRSAVRLDDREAEAKQQRWAKIAAEAAEQCYRAAPPEIMRPISWQEALADWQTRKQPGLMPDETLAGEPGHSLREIWRRLGQPAAISVFVGPEGGFAPHEADAGRAAGLQPLSLGPRILRTETAAIVLCALLMYEAGELE